LNTFDTQTATALFSLISIAIIWKLFDVWSHFRVAAVRQDLFEVRDALFDAALRNQFLFRHPAYVRLRQSINVYIRFAHKFTVSRLIAVIFMRKVWTFPKDNWAESLTELPAELQTELLSVQKTVQFRMVCHLLHLPRKVAWLLLDLTKQVAPDAATRAKKEMTEKVEIIEEQAAEEYELEACAAAAGR
jgi:hypothetical protein